MLKKITDRFSYNRGSHTIQLLVFFFAVVAIFLRRPDALLTPQFWAEDGLIFFSTAYNHSFHLSTLFMTYAGYFQLLPRILSELGAVFDIKYIPFIFSLSAILIQALPVAYIWSQRFDIIARTVRVKLLITLAYLCLPYTEEISSNATNSQWYLALTAYLIIVLPEAKSVFVKIADSILIVLAGLSGPFSIFLTPIAFIVWWIKKGRTNAWHFVLISVCALLNLISIALIDSAARGQHYLAATPLKLLDIIGSQVFATALLGYRSSGGILAHNWLAPFIAVIGASVVTYVFLASSYHLRLFILFGCLIFIAALFFPASSSSKVGLWDVLLREGVVARYFFVLHIGVYLCLIWLLLGKNLVLKYAAAVLIAIGLLVGIPADFKYSPYKDLHFQNYAYQLNTAHKGEKVRVPINPSSGWDIVLTKR